MMFRTMFKGIVSATLLAIALMVIGCAAAERHADIPAEAMLGAEGTSRLAYSAPSDGETFIYDATTEQMVYAGRVRSGETVVVDPERRRVTVDGRPVAEEVLRAGNQHRLYFLKEGELRQRTIHSEEIRVEQEETRIERERR